MGDCVNLRCAQEKRHFRKELISWYKKVPFAVGLELVAENLAGSSSGHIKTLLLPFNDMEIEEVEDFKNSPESVCIFCEGKSTEDLLEQENIPESRTSLEKTTSNSTNQIPTPVAKAHSPPIATAAASMADIPTLEGLNSFYSQLAMTSLLYQQQQLQSAAAVKTALSGNMTSSPASSSSNHKHASLLLGLTPNTLTPDMAFDLQAQSSCSAVLNQLSAAAAADTDLKVPEIRRKMKKDNPVKKTYTNRELNAAVEAIKSGAIGTRRAAQMYGVPRSTLRNKVCKSAEMNRQMAEVHGTLAGVAALNDHSESPPPSKSDSDSPTSSPNGRQASQDKTTEQHNTVNNMAQYNEILMKQLEELKTKQGLNDQLTMMNHQNRILGEMFNPLQQFAAAASYPFFMPQYSALTGMPSFDYMNPYASSMMMPYLPELMKNLAQKQLESDRASHLAASMQPPNARKSEQYSCSSSKVSLKTPKDDIKVPAYKPSTNNHTTSQLPSVSKSGSKSFSRDHTDKLSESPSTFSAADYLQRMIPSSSSKIRSPQPTNNSSKRSFSEASHNSTQQTHSSLQNGNGTGKKRPKRGQYRKYDSELLAQAVRSVQRGEMSVHRAGTHYGVPHSTLEYKVKERHLLRKRKIAENSENKTSLPTSTPQKASSTNITSSNNSPDSHLSESGKSPSPTLKVDELNKTSSSNNENAAKSFVSFPPTYDLNTSASELLMKLQDKVHQKAMNEIMNGGEKVHENTQVE